MSFINKILLEASFETDKQNSDTAKNILAELEQRVNSGKGTYGQGMIYIKLGELAFYLYDHRTNVAKQQLATRTYAGFSPKRDNPTILSYRNELDFKNKKFKLDTEYIYHEIIHYIDFKRSKSKEKGNKSHIEKGAEMQSSAKTREGNAYYNNPAEFNAHFMQYVYPNIEKFLASNEALQSFDDFKGAVIKGSNGSVMFYNYLDEKFKKKYIKRLYTVYEQLKKNNVMTGNSGQNAKEATKKEKGWILRKIKNFFTNAA